MNRSRWIVLFLICVSASGHSQDSLSTQKTQIDFRGYVKDLQMFLDNPSSNSILYANQLHNRLQLHVETANQITFRVEARNRVFTGPLVDEIPGFADYLDEDPGAVDLSYVGTVSDRTVYNIQLDRLQVGYHRNRWDVTAGRQRINWGLNAIWNPNDVFNAYNYFDFDYEERPGSDAVRIQYATGDYSFAEVAASKGKASDAYTCAMLYRFNTHGYDIQFLGGSVLHTPMAGIGWAGNIGNSGFKTEASWFGKDKRNNRDEKLIVSSQLDYSFEHGWYISGSYLFNSSIAQGVSLLDAAASFQLADPFPYRHAVLGQLLKEINPLWNANVGIIYSSGNDITLVPAITWMPLTNWEVLLYGQYGQSLEQGNRNTYNIYLRLKWSFAN